MRIPKPPTPYMRIGPKKLTFNAACMQLMPDVGFVKFLEHFESGCLWAQECDEYDSDSIPWRQNCSSREVRAKHAKWPRFYKLICDEMNWLIGNEYTIPATLKEDEGKRSIFFNLSNNEEESPLWNLKLSDLTTVNLVAELPAEELPDPNATHPVPGFPVTYIKPTVTRPNIIVGDFSYCSDEDFESHVTHHHEFYGDKLIIGKFCQIAAGVEFVMNGANHKMNSVSTFPFYLFERWKQEQPSLSDMSSKGDTVVGNDVWIGQNAIILPGVNIGNGAIIGTNSVVGSNVEPYTVVAGNPAKAIRKRFDDELISLLQAFKWWDKPVQEIQGLIPLLNDSDLTRVKRILRGYMSS